MRAEDNAYLLRGRGEVFPALIKRGIRDFLHLSKHGKLERTREHTSTGAGCVVASSCEFETRA
jgi:hypothetical protein